MEQDVEPQIVAEKTPSERTQENYLLHHHHARPIIILLIILTLSVGSAAIYWLSVKPIIPPESKSTATISPSPRKSTTTHTASNSANIQAGSFSKEALISAEKITLLTDIDGNIQLSDMYLKNSVTITTEGTYRKPKVNRAGELIAFEDNDYNLLLYSLSSQSKKKINKDLMESGSVFWHPNNSKIYFRSTNPPDEFSLNPKNDLYVHTIATNSTKQILGESRWENFFSFSPDFYYLAFSRPGEIGYFDQSDNPIVVHTFKDYDTESEFSYVPYVYWSPNSRRFFYHLPNNFAFQYSEDNSLYMYDIHSKRKALITSKLTGLKGHVDGLKISSDGNLVAYKESDGNFYMKDLSTNKVLLLDDTTYLNNSFLPKKDGGGVITLEDILIIDSNSPRSWYESLHGSNKSEGSPIAIENETMMGAKTRYFAVDTTNGFTETLFTVDTNDTVQVYYKENLIKKYFHKD